MLGNISLDHKSMDELRGLFGGFLGAARKAVVNLDDPEARMLADQLDPAKLIGFGFDAPARRSPGADLELTARRVALHARRRRASSMPSRSPCPAATMR